MIPTAEEFLKSKGLFNDKSMRLENIGLTSSEAMIEFAKLHVEAALKAADNNAQVDIVDWNDSGFNLTEPATPIYGVDSASILNAYPLTNIK